jgi:hypothetical protein
MKVFAQICRRSSASTADDQLASKFAPQGVVARQMHVCHDRRKRKKEHLLFRLRCTTVLGPVLILSALSWPRSALAGQHWGGLQDKGCSGIAIRTYSSRLWDIPAGHNWTTACQGASETINGQTYASPTRCIDLGVGGEWGEWDIPDAACNAYWGGPQDDGCSSVGIRTYSARLWNIPPGQAWNTACQGTLIDIEGQIFASPTRCFDYGAGGEWGEWDIPDSACKASWGNLQDNGCSSVGTRTYSARLWNIPPGQAWNTACQGTAITIQGQTFASPTRCFDKGASGEWGEWDISDNSCKASWGSLQDNGCSAGKHTYASRLWNIPPNQAWDAACRGTPITIQGQTLASPTRCFNKGASGEWGEWDVSDKFCRPSFPHHDQFHPHEGFSGYSPYSGNARDTKYSSDGTWEVWIEAFSTNLFVYDTIGATVHVQHDGHDSPADKIYIHNRYEGYVGSTQGESAAQIGSVADPSACDATNASSCECSQWGVGGISISVPAGYFGSVAPQATHLDVQGVRSSASVFIGNEQISLGEVGVGL